MFHDQCTEKVLEKLETNNVHVVILPANFTDHLELLDLSVDKATKEFLHKQFNCNNNNCYV